jgi:hypothetical protein
LCELGYVMKGGLFPSACEKCGLAATFTSRLPVLLPHGVVVYEAGR